MKIELKKISNLLPQVAYNAQVVDFAFTCQVFVQDQHIFNAEKKAESVYPNLVYTTNVKAEDLSVKATKYLQGKGVSSIHQQILNLFCENLLVEQNQSVKKLCETALVYRLPRHKEGEYAISCEAPTLQVGRGQKGKKATIGSEEHKAFLRQQYAEVGVEIVEFVNDRFTSQQTSIL